MVFSIFLPGYRHYLCSQYLSKADAMVTVSRGIAEEYRKTYGVPCEVLSNASFYEEQEPSVVSERQIRLVHHGQDPPLKAIGKPNSFDGSFGRTFCNTYDSHARSYRLL